MTTITRVWSHLGEQGQRRGIVFMHAGDVDTPKVPVAEWLDIGYGPCPIVVLPNVTGYRAGVTSVVRSGSWSAAADVLRRIVTLPPGKNLA